MNPALPAQLTATPNPLTNETTIIYTLLNDATVTLEVVNALQQRVALPLRSVRQPAGKQSVVLNAAALPSGVYTVRLIAAQTNGTVAIKSLQITVMK
jgi:hypothetical protein